MIWPRYYRQIQTTTAGAEGEEHQFHAPSQPQSSRSQETVHQAVLTLEKKLKGSD